MIIGVIAVSLVSCPETFTPPNRSVKCNKIKRNFVRNKKSGDEFMLLNSLSLSGKFHWL